MATDAFQRLAIVGAGAWGTALALTARRAGRDVRVWAREPTVAAALAGRGENPLYLPGLIPDGPIDATPDLAKAVADADAVLLVTPAQHTRAVAEALPPGFDRPIVVCSKGFEQATGALLTDAVAEAAPDAPIAALSGPSFAGEVAHGLPTAVTLASQDESLGMALVHALAGPAFRPYWTDDIIGVEIGGAVKNVLAIAAGIVMGRELGDNARAALLTRGLAELMRLGEALGGRRETLMGLAGLGDLMLTATSLQSRNTSLGLALGQGRTLEDVLGERRAVTEGVWTAAAAVSLAKRAGVDLPICAAVDRVLNHGGAIDSEMDALLARPLKAEM